MDTFSEPISMPKFCHVSSLCNNICHDKPGSKADNGRNNMYNNEELIKRHTVTSKLSIMMPFNHTLLYFDCPVIAPTCSAFFQQNSDTTKKSTETAPVLL